MFINNTDTLIAFSMRLSFALQKITFRTTKGDLLKPKRLSLGNAVTMPDITSHCLICYY